MFRFDRLDELAKENKRSNSYLCKILPRKPGYIADMKRNGKEPEQWVIEIWAEALNTTPAYLNGETDIKEKPTDQPVDEQLKRATLAMSRLSPQSREKALSYMDYLLANQEDNQ